MTANLPILLTDVLGSVFMVVLGVLSLFKAKSCGTWIRITWCFSI